MESLLYDPAHARIGIKMRGSYVAAWMLACLPAAAASFQVINLYGDVKVTLSPESIAQIRKSSPVREARADDVKLVRDAGTLRVEALPKDQARVDIELVAPYGAVVAVTTKEGAVELQGMYRRAVVRTESGKVKLTMPWLATRLRVMADGEPPVLKTPDGIRFNRKTIGKGESKRWTLDDRLEEMWVSYGHVTVDAGPTSALELVDMPVPVDSPVKMPWQAPGLLEAFSNLPAPRKAAVAEANRPDPSGAGGMPVFTAEVRVVNLTVSVTDSEGKPVTGLKREDFLILEDGRPQQVSYSGSEETPFNLALLLDLSGSTQRDREPMKEAARRFVRITRPQDRVALYALASDQFHVVSRLTAERERILQLIDAIPSLSGGSPVYDALVLSYAEEFWARAAERNALIVISDGVDNQLQGIRTPSMTSFKKLRQAAEGFHALFYPVFLDPFFRVPPPGWARKARQQMEEVALATGGRLFPAHSLNDLEPVYAQVAEELRSVYSLGYSPGNQEFNGSWRKVEVRVNKPGARVRTRAGYYAH
jgi:Ca-activated chloride channel family protein